MKINDKRNELFNKWSSMNDIDTSKLKFKKQIAIKQEETEYYKRWRFFDSYLKTKEKVENEKN